MLIDVRTSVPAAVVATVCALYVVARVATAAGPTPRRTATPIERQQMARAVFDQESAWTIETSQNFPQDHWSQRDDFHGREMHRAVELANERGVRIEDVLRAVDDDIHRRRATSPDAPDARDARAVPCKPRPFYD